MLRWGWNNKVLDLETALGSGENFWPAQNCPKVKPTFVSAEYQSALKQQGEGGEFALQKVKESSFFLFPSFLFVTPKRADKPRARTNVANNGLKINS